MICSLIVAVAGLIALVAILYGSTTTNKELNIDDIFESVRESFKDIDNLYLLVSNNENGTNDDQEIVKLQNNNELSEVLYISNKEAIAGDEMYRIYKINLEN